MANKKNLCRLRPIVLLCLAQGEKQALRPHFSPLSLSLYRHWSYLREETQKERGEKAREMDGVRERDINITFTECPFTLPLLSLEKVKTRVSPSLDSLSSPYPPPVGPCMKKQDFSALRPISPFVVYAHSVLAFTMHPSPHLM